MIRHMFSWIKWHVLEWPTKMLRQSIHTFRPEQNDHRHEDHIFILIYLDIYDCSLIQIPLKVVCIGPINYKPT